MGKTLLLSKDDLQKVLDIKVALATTKEVFRAHGNNEVVMPAKVTLDLGESDAWPHYNAYVNSMPAYVGPFDIAGIKFAGGFWDNPRKGLASIMGMIMLIDPRTGIPLAIMEGSLITGLRTGAATAIGLEYLASDNAIVGLLGSGVQARFIVEALNELLKIKELKINDKIGERARELEVYSRQQLGVNATVVSNGEQAVENSDIIITATTSKQPVVTSRKLKKGATIAAIGSYREIDESVVKMADKIVVDSLEQTKHRGTLKDFFDKGVIGERQIYAEIGEIMVGKKKGRESDEELILYQPIGMGSEDVALGKVAFDLASKESLGEEFTFI